jgi:hypothetical protein
MIPVLNDWVERDWVGEEELRGSCRDLEVTGVDPRGVWVGF